MSGFEKNFNTKELAEVLLENQRRQAEVDAASEKERKEEVDSLSPLEKLTRWKNLSQHQFDHLSDEDKTLLIDEYNNLIEQVKTEGGEIDEERVADGNDFRNRLKAKSGPSLERLREVLNKKKDTE